MLRKQRSIMSDELSLLSSGLVAFWEFVFPSSQVNPKNFRRNGGRTNNRCLADRRGRRLPDLRSLDASVGHQPWADIIAWLAVRTEHPLETWDKNHVVSMSHGLARK